MKEIYVNLLPQSEKGDLHLYVESNIPVNEQCNILLDISNRLTGMGFENRVRFRESHYSTNLEIYTIMNNEQIHNTVRELDGCVIKIIDSVYQLKVYTESEVLYGWLK